MTFWRRYIMINVIMIKHRRSYQLTERFRSALRATTLSLPGIARAMDVSPATLELYKNRYEPSLEMAVKLRRFLLTHSQRLATLARQLPKDVKK